MEAGQKGQREPDEQKLVFDYGENDERETELELKESQIEVILKTFKKRLMGTNFEFDAKRYLEKNPDVKRAGADPYKHFLTHGVKEGRDF